MISTEEKSEDNENPLDTMTSLKKKNDPANEYGTIFVCGRWRQLSETSEINFHEEEPSNYL